MRAMILAAGQGKRLRPITNTIPKPMVTAGGHSLIAWSISKLKRLGITDIVVNGAYLKDTLFSYLQSHDFGVKLSFSPEDGDGLETAGGIIKALPLLGEEPFLVVNGDVFLDSSYDFVLPCPLQADSAIKSGQSKEHPVLAHLYLTANPAHNLQGDYAVAKNGCLQYGHDFTFAGIAWYHPQFFAGCTVKREPLRPYFDRYVNTQQITASVLKAKWFDVGTVERLHELNAYLLEHDGWGEERTVPSQEQTATSD